MVRKFLARDESDNVEEPRVETCYNEAGEPKEPFIEGYFFFYGPLMDPDTLAKVLQLSEPPKLRPARVMSHETKLWGEYPALVQKMKMFHAVDGVACEILLREHWDRLLDYVPGPPYHVAPILIDFLDTGEKSVGGEAFFYEGDPEELRDGSFNLESWLRKRNPNRRYEGLKFDR